MTCVTRWLVVLFLVMSLAGCTDDEAPPPATEDSVSTVGAISGVTVSPQIQPIADAQLELVPAGVRTESDLFGRFRFEAIPPGTYTLQAIAEGYTLTNSTMVVQAGETLRPRVVLDPIPDPQPRHDTHEFGGFFQASGGAGTPATGAVLGTAGLGNCTCVFQLPAPAALAGITVEAAWTDTVSGAEATQFRWNLTLDSNRSASGAGASPLRANVLDVDIPGGFAGAASIELRFAPDEEWPTYDQRFEVFVTVWEIDPPPPDFSAL